MKSATIAAAVLAGTTAVAAAQTATPGIDQRRENQQDRIGAGVASGQLTPRETMRLERGQQHIQNMENRAKADGVVTNAERARIQHAQDVQSRRIYREKHDRQGVR
jgi:uncharacterized membrane protein YebE (DUF533 family)